MSYLDISQKLVPFSQSYCDSYNKKIGMINKTFESLGLRFDSGVYLDVITAINVDAISGDSEDEVAITLAYKVNELLSQGINKKRLTKFPWLCYTNELVNVDTTKRTSDSYVPYIVKANNRYKFTVGRRDNNLLALLANILVNIRPIVDTDEMAQVLALACINAGKYKIGCEEYYQSIEDALNNDEVTYLSLLAMHNHIYLENRNTVDDYLKSTQFDEQLLAEIDKYAPYKEIDNQIPKQEWVELLLDQFEYKTDGVLVNYLMRQEYVKSDNPIQQFVSTAYNMVVTYSKHVKSYKPWLFMHDDVHCFIPDIVEPMQLSTITEQMADESGVEFLIYPYITNKIFDVLGSEEFTCTLLYKLIAMLVYYTLNDDGVSTGEQVIMNAYNDVKSGKADELNKLLSIEYGKTVYDLVTVQQMVTVLERGN